ncbi:unnamed protein product, partial [Callosobruchus maculatus]
GTFFPLSASARCRLPICPVLVISLLCAYPYARFHGPPSNSPRKSLPGSDTEIKAIMGKHVSKRKLMDRLEKLERLIRQRSEDNSAASPRHSGHSGRPSQRSRSRSGSPSRYRRRRVSSGSSSDASHSSGSRRGRRQGYRSRSPHGQRNRRRTSTTTPYPGGRNVIRQALLNKGTPEQALETTIQAISPSTLKQYGTTYKLWWHYCSEKHIDAFNASVGEVICFLQDLLDKRDSKYGTFNSHRSALASSHQAT